MTLSQQLLFHCWADGDAAVFSWISAPSKGQVTPSTIELPSLHLCHHFTGFPPPQHALGRVQPPPSRPTRTQPSTEITAPQHRLCQWPSSRTCSQDGRGATWVSKCYHRPLPFSSVRASRPPHQPVGLAEGLLLTADTFGLTVNNKTKSLCTALQTLLHPPGYTAELHDRECKTCAPLYVQSPCWQHQLSSDNKPQWQWKERNSSSKRNK